MIEYIAYEETDEFLTYEMQRIVNYHERFRDLPQYHQAATIIPTPAYEKPFFKDTLLLEPGDNEMVPTVNFIFPSTTRTGFRHRFATSAPWP